MSTQHRVGKHCENKNVQVTCELWHVFAGCNIGQLSCNVRNNYYVLFFSPHDEPAHDTAHETLWPCARACQLKLSMTLNARAVWVWKDAVLIFGSLYLYEVRGMVIIRPRNNISLLMAIFTEIGFSFPEYFHYIRLSFIVIGYDN